MEKTPEELAAEQAAADKAAADAAAAAKADKTVKVRVLASCEWGAPNALGNVPASRLKEAKAAGLVDDTKAAVAYAESLQSDPAQA